MAEELGDKTEGIGPTSYMGNGMHLMLSQHEFNCPICTCRNDVAAKIEKSKLPVFNTKCAGCKRKIQVFSCPFTGRLTATEIINTLKQKK